MDARNLSKRMQAVADLVPAAKTIADIGSDHAYLPAYLLLNGIIQFAIAGEVRKGPLKNVTLEIERLQLQGKMEARLGDGLDVIHANDQVEVITIAGMGGELITKILERGIDKLNSGTTLVLQPNVDENILRSWLMKHNFKIIAENIVVDANHYYEMIKAQYCFEQVVYSKTELDFGPILKQQQSPIFKAKWNHRLKKNNEILAKLKKSNTHPVTKIKKLEAFKSEMEDVLND
ncbi:tRNA (adenine(22)-N(1))-methyltransferase [Fructilactobacillus lindneri]|uniref:tRNA methyltransferase n=1 Tax=Fructilactobacillus lindneri TaxID=53444 RepID=A0AB33BN13_9LACO|nr:class I SAM-dependent methyltransferase [Fructilactobacillus lindneri]ANZ58141.1 tRNA methyltransferase [Fructilactobacillus lindneri]ANZ59462.1 tRNA methyltransferase [Fructilactobacillus lindneri]POG98754.1 tRNA methyltransferase [Fructilactobacillus lindneri]POH03027.1 tRNA methyltransferase [Fructilactobacillus lindneri]POH04142.1 tRNA methyltransferase [Fructilactobacillus lindneri]